jgi:hypothetical protein
MLLWGEGSREDQPEQRGSGPSSSAARSWGSGFSVRSLIRKVHIYAGLFTFCHLVIYGIAGLVSRFSRNPRNLRSHVLPTPLLSAFTCNRRCFSIHPRTDTITRSAAA